MVLLGSDCCCCLSMGLRMCSRMQWLWVRLLFWSWLLVVVVGGVDLSGVKALGGCLVGSWSQGGELVVKPPLLLMLGRRRLLLEVVTGSIMLLVLVLLLFWGLNCYYEFNNTRKSLRREQEKKTKRLSKRLEITEEYVKK